MLFIILINNEGVYNKIKHLIVLVISFLLIEYYQNNLLFDKLNKVMSIIKNRLSR